jgi:hypothetical protein
VDQQNIWQPALFICVNKNTKTLPKGGYHQPQIGRNIIIDSLQKKLAEPVCARKLFVPLRLEDTVCEKRRETTVTNQIATPKQNEKNTQEYDFFP